MSRDETIVEPVSVISLAPRISDPDIARWLPKSGEYPTRTSIIMRGINSAIANGLRRILLSEMDNLALQIDQDSFETDDPFPMIDMITRRVLLIPLTQSRVEEGARFVLDVRNETDEPMDVATANLLRVHDDRARQKHSAAAAPPFFETITILTLGPGKHIRFLADVVRGNGYDDAAFATAYTAMAIPLDERPLEIDGAPPTSETARPYHAAARTVASSSVSDPRVYQLIYESVGKGDPSAVMGRALDVFAARTRAIAAAPCVRGQDKQSGGSSVQTIAPGGDAIAGLYTITIQGETHTVGELFSRCCIRAFPSIEFVACDRDDLTEELVIRVRTIAVPIETVVRDTIQYALDRLADIRKYF
ncbi:MAG: hypothetical protein M0R66_03070 [Candidatus Omnitrophica bacterium]|nr:hypothetical protein [Candidatus Omnitrophota bacterium]